jgi:hypothetical protein
VKIAVIVTPKIKNSGRPIGATRNTGSDGFQESLEKSAIFGFGRPRVMDGRIVTGQYAVEKEIFLPRTSWCIAQVTYGLILHFELCKSEIWISLIEVREGAFEGPSIALGPIANRSGLDARRRSV